MACAVCATLQSKLAATQMDLENVRVWLRSFAEASDAAAYERVRRLAPSCR